MPVLSADADCDAALTALEVLQPRRLLTIDNVKAAAIGAKADLDRPLLVIDIGAQLTEVAVLGYGSVIQTRRVLLGTGDLATTAKLVDAVVEMVTSLLRHDCAALVVDALDREPLLVGGGAMRPEITYQLVKRLGTTAQPAPPPQTAAVRGAAAAALAAYRHPAVSGGSPHSASRLPMYGNEPGGP